MPEVKNTYIDSVTGFQVHNFDSNAEPVAQRERAQEEEQRRVNNIRETYRQFNGHIPSWMSFDEGLSYQPYPDSIVYRTSDAKRPTYSQSYTYELTNLDRQMLDKLVEGNLDSLCEIILDKLTKREKIKSLSPIMKSFLDSKLIKLNE